MPYSIISHTEINRRSQKYNIQLFDSTSLNILLVVVPFTYIWNLTILTCIGMLSMFLWINLYYHAVPIHTYYTEPLKSE